MSNKTNLGLVSFCQEALSDGCGYIWGAMGQLCSPSMRNIYADRYPKQASNILQKGARWDGKRVMDCSGLIKYYLMADHYGDNPAYKADYDVIFYNAASERGEIDTMPDIPGVLLHKPGHIGVYVGEGRAIESKGVASGVVQTELQAGGWKQWSKCPYIDYVAQTAPDNGTLAVGDAVTIQPGAKYTNNVPVPASCIGKPYTVAQVGDGKVRLGEINSWVPSNMVTASGAAAPAPATAKVTARSGLNVRKGPGTNHSVITAIPCGGTVIILSRTGDWAQVTYKGRTGYCATQYLQALAPNIDLLRPAT